MTAMQQLIKWLDSFEDFPTKPNAQNVKEKAWQLLSIEKEQVIDAYWAGLDGMINDYSESKTVGNEIRGINYGGGAEKYYSEKYSK